MSQRVKFSRSHKPSRFPPALQDVHRVFMELRSHSDQCVHLSGSKKTKPRVKLWFFTCLRQKWISQLIVTTLFFVFLWWKQKCFPQYEQEAVPQTTFKFMCDGRRHWLSALRSETKINQKRLGLKRKVQWLLKSCLPLFLSLLFLCADNLFSQQWCQSWHHFLSFLIKKLMTKKKKKL